MPKTFRPHVLLIAVSGNNHLIRLMWGVIFLDFGIL